MTWEHKHYYALGLAVFAALPIILPAMAIVLVWRYAKLGYV